MKPPIGYFSAAVKKGVLPFGNTPSVFLTAQIPQEFLFLLSAVGGILAGLQLAVCYRNRLIVQMIRFCAKIYHCFHDSFRIIFYMIIYQIFLCFSTQ